MATRLALVSPIGHLVNSLPLSSVEYFSGPIWSNRVPVWRTPNRLSLRGGHWKQTTDVAEPAPIE